MSRREFTKKTMREALARSGKLCEAVGAMYGLEPGKRCNTPLGPGIEYDHIVLEANSHDNSLSNCAAVCPRCHKRKTAKHDIPMAAKTVRMQDKANNITRKTPPIPGPKFPRTEKAMKRVPKPPLTPRPLFVSERAE